jgi:hypothetical protein
MNPYLEHEDAWHNFHEQFPGAAVAMLVPQVGTRYYVKVDEHVYIHELPEEHRRVLGRPDVSLTRNPAVPGSGAGGSATRAAPREVHLPVVDRVGMSYVEIRDRRSRRLVTVIELLSPSNKGAGCDRDQYEYKRAEILASQTHLVEIDLLRGGGRMPFEEPVECDYCVMVSRYRDRPRAGLWPIGLRDPLPRIPIPLLDDDSDVELDLQALLHHLYDSGGYANFMYDSEPDPRLSPDDAAWARELLAAAGIRPSGST